ncbi:FAD-dependent oxidoreductase [Streptomyces aurantiogriseus]|uniref:FAD/NAD(P)-binding oxidoreductase n=1 Tax=Streptomyces aurantiogriseus TaxID=66870 RepID=A0A918CGZ9_9ACTN|nr:FAD-dependent oxidoreductase [Streptomyces aurantiogriseus]GGR23469.1 FAD/NAD(P)-binding oxidoreductase [Streptomyces aurantiogriseus]
MNGYTQRIQPGRPAGDVVIVGGGPVGHRLAERLHHHGHQGTVTLLDAEPGHAYHRVLLTSVLDGGLDPADLELPPVPGARGRRDVRVTGVDRRRQRVGTANGESHRYDTLVLATGAEPRIPAVPGMHTASGRLIDGITGLRSLADCARVRGERVVVLGAGPLGVETAVALRRSGRDVSLVHPGPHPLNRWLDATAGDLLARHLVSLGIRVETGRSAARVEAGELVLDDGGLLTWDTLVCCTGTEPRTELARAAGLRVRTGVLVDGEMRTSDPHVRAVGDCAEHPGWFPGLLASGWDQADLLARTLTGHRSGGRRPRTVLRLRVPGLHLGVLGRPGLHREAGAAEGDVVTFSDPSRGRYATLAVDPAGRLSSAVLVGLPQALATLTQLHDARRPLPDDRLALLLGETAVGRRTSVLPPQDADTVLCRCNNVTALTLTGAWQNGSRSLRALADTTRVTTGCGTCADQIRELCAQLATAEKPVARHEPPVDARASGR